MEHVARVIADLAGADLEVEAGEEPRWEDFTGREEVVPGDVAGLKDGQEVTVGQN